MRDYGVCDQQNCPFSHAPKHVTAAKALVQAGPPKSRARREALQGAEACGEVLCITDARGAVSRWIGMIQETMIAIRILAYTFDLAGADLDLVSRALTHARERRVPVTIVVDKGWGKGTSMRNLRPTILRLMQHGAKVRTSSGSKRLHAKILLADHLMSIGSANWTLSSQGQIERIAILKLPGWERRT
jgi:phosphatidylserine/phosphatidylglycerophosphate/cardiolipin synthase-like enzyme